MASLDQSNLSRRQSIVSDIEMSVGSATSEVMINAYTIGEHLGSGFQGSVYKATRKRDGKNCVVKVLTANEERGLNMARSEVNLLRRIEGKEHLARIIESCEEFFLQKVYIFMEDAGDMSLEGLMKAHKAGLPTDMCKDLFK